MRLARLSVLSTSILIAACSSGGSTFNGAEPPSASFAITSANATTVARASWEAVLASGEFGELGGSLGLTSSAPRGVSKTTQAFKAAGIVVGALQQVPLGPDVQPCLVDGFVTVSGEIADLLTLTRDDTFQVLYELCDDGAGEVIDGLVEFTVSEFTGDLLFGTYMLSMDAVVTNLQAATGTDTVTNNGDATVTLDTQQAPYVEAGISGIAMTIDYNARSETLRNYVSNQTLDGGVQTLPYTMSAAGSLDSTELAGVVQYSTPVTFAGEGVDYPDSGSMLVEGENSSARLTAVDNVNVTIEVDTNGDGVIDNTINTTWADLASS